MGWFFGDLPGHEGYVVGLVAELRPGGFTAWMELAYPAEHLPRELPVDVIQVGCECGWRSRRFRAPAGTTWSPHIVVLGNDEVESEACRLWQRHIEEEQSRGAPLLEPFEGGGPA